MDARHRSNSADPQRIVFDPWRTWGAKLYIVHDVVAGLFIATLLTIAVRSTHWPTMMFAGFIFLAFVAGLIYYWRSIGLRTTHIHIDAGNVILEEYLRGQCMRVSVISGQSFYAIYGLRRCRELRYEVWARSLQGQETFIFDTLSSKRSTEAIRHHVATQLQVREDTAFATRWF